MKYDPKKFKERQDARLGRKPDEPFTPLTDAERSRDKRKRDTEWLYHWFGVRDAETLVRLIKRDPTRVVKIIWQIVMEEQDDRTRKTA